MRYNQEDAYRLKNLAENLFGQDAWYNLKHCQDIRVWKRYSKRILSAISASIKSTVEVADDLWFEEIEREISRGKETIDSSNSLDLVFANLAASLGNISFIQIGAVPLRYRKKNVVTRPGSNWKLNKYRSVQYVQNKEQKQNTHNKVKN